MKTIKKMMIMGLAFVMLFPLMGFVGCDGGTDYELLGRIEALEREMEELRKEAEREAERVSGLETEIEVLNKQVENLTGQLYALTGQLNKLAGLLGEQAEIVLLLGETIEELKGTISSLNRQIEILKRELWGVIPFWFLFPGWEEYFWEEYFAGRLRGFAPETVRERARISQILTDSFFRRILPQFDPQDPKSITVFIRSMEELKQFFDGSPVFNEKSLHYNLIYYRVIRENFNDEFFSEYMFFVHMHHIPTAIGLFYQAFNATIEDEVLTLYCNQYYYGGPIWTYKPRLHLYTFRQDDVKNITTVQLA